MATISRYEFMGSKVYFVLLCLSVVLIPLAVLYLLNGTIRVEEQVDDAEACVRALRASAKNL